MREILFRGKSKVTDRWIYGWYGRNFGTEETQIIEPSNCCYIIVKENTVGQYTGLTDRNGKKIFEGDILRWTRKDIRLIGHYAYDLYGGYYYGDTLQVVSNGAGFMLARLKDDMLDIPNANAKVDNYAFWNFEGMLEVIGNIHDNPELMEGNNERENG